MRPVYNPGSLSVFLGELTQAEPATANLHNALTSSGKAYSMPTRGPISIFSGFGPSRISKPPGQSKISMRYAVTDHIKRSKQLKFCLGTRVPIFIRSFPCLATCCHLRQGLVASYNKSQIEGSKVRFITDQEYKGDGLTSQLKVPVLGQPGEKEFLFSDVHTTHSTGEEQPKNQDLLDDRDAVIHLKYYYIECIPTWIQE